MFKELFTRPDIGEIIQHVPIVNLLPVIDDIVTRIPKSWAAMSEEHKQKASDALLKLAVKAAIAAA